MEFHVNGSSFLLAENDTLSRRTNMSSHLTGSPVASTSLMENSTDPETTDYVYGVIYPILLLVATVGNVLTLVILGSEKIKGTMHVYLMTVAFADLSVMWLELPRFINQFYPKPADNTSVFTIGYARFQGFDDWSQEAALLLSEWALIAFSIDRLFAIVKPFRFRELRTVQTATIVCGVLFFLAMIQPLQMIVSYYYLFDPGNILTPAPEPAALETYRHLHEISGVVIIWIDFLALLLINAIIISFIQHQRHSQLGKMRASQESNSDKKYRNSYMLLMSSAILYLVCQLPSAVFYSLLMAHSSTDTSNGGDDMPPEFQRPYPFVRVMFCLNYTLSCYLYLLVSKRFRNQLVTICRRCYGPVDLQGKPKKPSFRERDARKFSLSADELLTDNTAV